MPSDDPQSPKSDEPHADAGGNAPNSRDAQRLLRELALDLRWSWNHAADPLWNEIDPELWSSTHSPWVVLQNLSRRRLEVLLADEGFRARLERLAASRHESPGEASWYAQTHAQAPLSRVAYFSMEFMLSEALPIYAGGLGNVAGDQLKAASDLGIPVVGIGLLYQQGYFRQVIGTDGSQQALFPYNDPGQLPVSAVRQDDGQMLRLQIKLPGYSLWLRVWEVIVGRLRLYLLDSNDIANYPVHRGITSELYGGDMELRLQQELVLGIGGWRLLEALHLAPDVCHLNEGHAAFVILERARSFMQASGQPFEVALAVTRAGNLFTTHTAVPAGFDRFPAALVERYLGTYARDQLHLSRQELLALGRGNASDEAEPFNMAYLAMRGCATVNGVSRLHGVVSRQIFQSLFPRWPTAEVPVGHITNGVHTPSWDSPGADELWTSACGKQRWTEPLNSLGNRIRDVPVERIWQCRTRARLELVNYARERLSRQLAATGASPEEIEAARHVFRPEVLTLGFARRFATYKRPNLLLHDPERLVRLLTHPQRPVQLILAGKAHPEDAPGQALIREWIRFVRRQDVRAHALFLSDYDMLLTEQLVQGVDVWINTPRRPWEACGTSGMKVLVNGGLNLSELDGWWAEAYAPSVGWALGDGGEHGEDAGWDAAEAEQLYRLLEEQVVPEFYQRDASDLPQAWLTRVRESMATLTPTYSANRCVQEYLEHCYLPAAAAYRARASDKGEEGARMVSWRTALAYNWHSLSFGALQVQTHGGRHYFRVPVHLGALPAQSVRVELYADVSGDTAFTQEMTLLPQADGATDAVYEGSVPALRAPADYTVRIVPAYPGVRVPLEAPYILWQR